MVFSCYSYEFLATPKFWAIFFASYIIISASFSKKSCSSSSSQLCSAYPSLLLDPQPHLPHFSCAIGDSQDLMISSSSSPSLTVWWPWEMMSLMEWKSKKGYFGGLKGCNVFFRRKGSRLGQHHSNSFQGGGSILFLFFRWILTVLIKFYPKKTFLRFYWFYWACAKILDFFLTNLHFWEISLYHLKDLLNSCLFWWFSDF